MTWYSQNSCFKKLLGVSFQQTRLWKAPGASFNSQTHFRFSLKLWSWIKISSNPKNSVYLRTDLSIHSSKQTSSSQLHYDCALIVFHFAAVWCKGQLHFRALASVCRTVNTTQLIHSSWFQVRGALWCPGSCEMTLSKEIKYLEGCFFLQCPR